MTNTKEYQIKEIPHKNIWGRSPLDRDGNLCLFWAASGLEVSVQSKEVWLLIESGYDLNEIWLTVSINGARVIRQIAPRGEHWICLAQSLNPATENTILIQKETQPMPDDIRHSLKIKKIALSQGGTFCKVPAHKAKIEFVGDSITSGEGLYGNPSEQDWITPWFSATSTYAAQIGLAMDAEVSVLSQCGWGICWGWDGNPASALPPHYENLCSILKGAGQVSDGAAKKWNFSAWQPDYIIINLGTNDNGAFNQPAWKDSDGAVHTLLAADGSLLDSTKNQIIDTVASFLATIRKNNPNAKILWTWGMIRLDKLPPLVAAGVEKYQKASGDKNVALLELDPMEELEKREEDKGSRGHPGMLVHQKACDKILEKIKLL